MSFRILPLLMLIAAGVGSAKAQEPAGGPSGAPALSIDEVKARADAVNARTDLSEEVRKRIQQSHDAAVALLEVAAASEAKAAAFKEAVTTAPEAARAALDEAATIEVPNDRAALVTAAERDLDNTRQKELLAAEEAALAQAETDLKALEASLAVENSRPEAITQEGAKAREVERQAEEALAKLHDASDPEQTAERVRLQAQVIAARAEQSALEQEGLSAAARNSLLEARRDLQSRKLAMRKARVAALQDLVQSGVMDVAAAAERLVAAAEAKAEATESAPDPLAVEIKVYAAELRTLADRITAARRDQEEVANRLAKLEDSEALVTRQIEATGGAGAGTHILLDQRRVLPDPPRLRRERRTRTKELAEVRLTRLKVNTELERMEDPATVEGERRKWLETKRTVLGELDEQYGQLILELGELDLAKRGYVDKLEEFQRLLDEKLFWVRSSPVLGGETFTELPAALNWLAGPARGARLQFGLGEVVSRAPLRVGGLAVLAAVLLLLRRRLRRRIASYGPKVRRITGDSYLYTMEGLGLVLLIALPSSLLMWVVGRELFHVPEAGDWLQGLGKGLQSAAVVMAGFMVLRELCGKGGLAETHLRWKSPVVARVRKSATWIPWLYVPAIVVVESIFTETTGRHVHSLGRVTSIAALLWIAFWTAYLLYPRGGLVLEMIKKKPDGILARLRYAWIWLLVAAPVFMAGLAAAGYLATALKLSDYVHRTLVIAVGAVTAYYFLLRYFTIRERRMALQRARDERKAKREAAKQVEEGTTAAQPAGEEIALADVEKEAIDLAQVGMQTRRLLRAVVVFMAVGALWLVWAGALPALRTLDADPVLGSATAADLILSAVALIVTFVVARNLPGILEIAILQRLPLAAGSRYSAATLAQYLVVAVGLVAVFQILPINWSQFGWMVAALSVGLGFGLQEIVANFVCGIILLFERPIRVGDVVTVANVSGTVTRMRLRATTIVDWDRKEFIVPNKEFITGQVLNWTLTNSTNRLVLTAGIAYGSDTERARQVLLEVLREHPDVLPEPGPSVTFDQLGDSSLNFTLRCYLPNLDRRLGVTHEIYTEIHRRFNEEGIEIPFPQRDLHIRSGWGGGDVEN